MHMDTMSSDDIMQLDIEPSSAQPKNPRRNRSSLLNQQSNGNATAVHDTSPFADIIGSSPVPPVV
jgi:hypothetical protein